ncbi:MAG: division/cell wall cluster transcriptional repressor MraZ [Panacagrimonas sp.]
MFTGSQELTIDDKGRLAIPARYRQQLADTCDSQLVITMGPDTCLEVFPAPEFQRLALDIQNMEDLDNAEVLKNCFIALACESEIDKQGRVLLPPMLRKRAKLNGSAVLMGKLSRFDLWATDLWNERFGEDAEQFAAQRQQAFRTLKR